MSVGNLAAMVIGVFLGYGLAMVRINWRGDGGDGPRYPPLGDGGNFNE